MIQCLHITCTLEADANFGSSLRMENQRSTLGYVPGSTVRGCLAAHYGFPPASPETEFISVFCSGDVRFTNLYPVYEGSRSLPVPLSARTWKTKPGYAGDSDVDMQGCGVCDELFQPDLVAQHGSALEPLSGFHVVANGAPHLLRSDHTVSMHTEVDDATQSASEATLHAYERLRADRVFYGMVIGPQADIGNLCARLGGDSGHMTVGIGKRRAIANLGWATDYIEQPAEEGLALTQANSVRCALVLHSDAILLDEFLRCRHAVPAKVIADELDLAPNTVGLVDHVAGIREVEGWNNAMGLPRSVDVAVCAGSVFIYDVDLQSAGVDEGELSTRLHALTLRGLGLRVAEGFGEVSFSDAYVHTMKSRGECL